MSVFRGKNVDDEQKALMEEAAMAAEEMVALVSKVRGGRYKSLFQTNLEDAMMWLNKAIAHDGIERQ